jgi:curved DNA-binding protein CbpA
LKRIYFDLAKRYHPDTLPSDAPLQVRKLREDVLALLNEAYRVLSNDGSRDKYIQQLEMVESGAVDLNLEAILQAEEEFRLAVTLFKARRYADALAKLDACIQLNGEEGEFYAWRGYAKFLTSTDKKAAYPEALGDLQTALRLSPKCAIAHVYGGHMAKLLDDAAAAEKAYKKALDLDPKQVEAERELRLMAQRASKKK